MKIELDLWRCLLDVYTKFQIDISKHVGKIPGKPRKIQNAQKIIVKIPKIRFFTENGTYVRKYTAGHLCTKFEGFILIYEAIIKQGKSEGFDSCDRPSYLKLESNRLFFSQCDFEI